MDFGKCMTMLLAGGRGVRLGPLTQHSPKPAVSFGGGFRIIDFTLCNCMLSDTQTVGVLSQYLADCLHEHIDNSYFCKALDIHKLPSGDNEYTGTANAIYQNLRFIERYAPEHVMILSGDHVYQMDYRPMLQHHIRTKAAVTIAATPVDPSEVSRYGIITADPTTQIYGFDEKPAASESNLASMGVYIFKWSELRRQLIEDNDRPGSVHDFGRDIIPAMLNMGKPLAAYPFRGYWRDVGSVDSLWQANMDLLDNAAHTMGCLSVFPCAFPVHPEYIQDSEYIKNSIISNRSAIRGAVNGSVVADSVRIGEGAQVNECVVMPGASIGKGACLNRVVVGQGAQIQDNVVVGGPAVQGRLYPDTSSHNGIYLIAPHTPER
jgi:glucose-1-phosphate adenylyltransferase